MTSATFATPPTTTTGHLCAGAPAGHRRPVGHGEPGAGTTGPGSAPWTPADTVADGDGHLRGELSLCVGEAA